MELQELIALLIPKLYLTKFIEIKLYMEVQNFFSTV